MNGFSFFIKQYQSHAKIKEVYMNRTQEITLGLLISLLTAAAAWAGMLAAIEEKPHTTPNIPTQIYQPESFQASSEMINSPNEKSSIKPVIKSN